MLLQNIVHLSLSNRTSFYVSCRMCKCGGGRRDAIQTLSLFLKLCLAKWHFSFKSVINSCSSNYLESEHTNTWKKQNNNNTQAGMPNDRTCQSCYTLDDKHNSVSQTGRLHTNTRAPPPIIRHRVTVAVQGETGEAFDRVSDIVQCLLLHSFSITRQCVRSSLAAATSFSLADLHVRTGPPISFIYCGFLE